jgi:hypothetical protein
VEQPSDIVDDHIDDFIQVGRRRWDVVCFIIDRDPIYDIEGSSQAEGVEVSSSEDWSSCMYDSDIWHPSDDMVTYLFTPSRMTYCNILRVDLQSSLDTYPFEDADLFYEDFHHCAHILIDTRSWPAQSSPRSTLPNKVLSC